MSLNSLLLCNSLDPTQNCVRKISTMTEEITKIGEPC